MTHARPRIAALLAVAVLALTACSGGTAEPDPVSEPAASAPGATSDTGVPSSDQGASAAPDELMGVIGSVDDPEAYVIALLDAEGNPVTSLPAGDYRLTFVDDSQMHNFHLTGDGVDVRTEVQGTDASTVEITLVPGTYTFFCDPHPGSMLGEFEVTG